MRVGAHAQRKIAEHETQRSFQSCLDFLDDRIGLTAVRALEVAELDERDGRVRRSLGVFVLEYGGSQACMPVGHATR